MGLFVRSDNTHFVVNSTRLKYQQQKKSMFERMVSSDAELYGSFVRINKLSDGSNGIVYSFESGYSVGDFIMSVLPKNQVVNAIYAEEVLDDRGQTRKICVVIVDHQVVGDFDLTNPLAQEELSLILDSNEDVKFNIFCAADDTLIRSESTGKPAKFFSIPDSKVDLHCSVLPFLKNAQLKDLAEFELIELSSVIKGKSQHKRFVDVEKKSGKNKGKTVVHIFVLIIGLGLILNYFWTEEEQIEEIDPFENYRSSIRNLVSPVAIVNQAIKLIYATSILSGWELESGLIEGNAFSTRLINTGGDITGLLPLKKEFGGFITSTESKTLIANGGIELAPRMFPDVTYIFDEIDYLLYEEVVIRSGNELTSVGEIDNGSYYQRQYKMDMQSVTVNELQSFAVFLRDKPIVINKIEVTPNVTGHLVSMSITIFGVKR